MDHELDPGFCRVTVRNPVAMMRRTHHPIAIIVIAQLFGTSLWFSANSAADDLMRQWGASPPTSAR